MAVVVVISGDAARELVLERGRPVVIGRSEDADLRLDDSLVSRHHCAISLVGFGVLVRDLKSANGTLIRDRSVGKAIVRNEVNLEIGRSRLLLRVLYEGSADLPLDFKLNCEKCGGSVSFAGGDDDVIEIEESFRCLSCRTDSALHEFTERENEIVERLAAEGFDVLERLSISHRTPIYRALRRSLDQIVALKVLQLSSWLPAHKVDRFLKEARAEAQLGHPNIVTVYDVHHADDLVFFTMELVDGVNLLQEIGRAGPMAPWDSLDVATQIARALAHAHERGIVHRNVNPSNAMITRESVVKLIDFGLAKSLLALEESSVTGEGATAGTAGYMAPEQLGGPRTADARAYLYGLGATLYHCLAGRPPFRSVSEAMGDGAPQPLDERVPPAVREVVARLMQPKPDDRFQSAGEALAGIRVAWESLVRAQAERTWRWKSSLVRASDGPIQGNALAESLRALERERKTGVLEIEGDVAQGRLYVAAGRVVLAEGARRATQSPPPTPERVSVVRGDDAVGLLLTQKKGSFRFTARALALRKTLDLSAAEALERRPGGGAAKS